MANATDFIGNVYDTLARMLNVDNTSQSMCMQLSWPGFTLSPEDFKPADSPNGAYDNDIAIETFSRIANIAPAANTTQFENSGFEIDDLYEILILSAIPVGTTQETIATNPLYRLFSDAKFELEQARRGSKDDPNAFYYPCTATPSHWYDEASSQLWTAVDIKSKDIKPITANASLFLKSGGMDLVNKGMLRIKPTIVDVNLIKKNIDNKIEDNSNSIKKRSALNLGIATPLTNLRSAGINVEDRRSINNPLFMTMNENITTNILRDSSVFNRKYSPFNMFSDKNFRLNAKNITLNQKSLNMNDTRKVDVAQKYLITDIINQQMRPKPISDATNEFGISFKFCQVNINRPWLKLALLKNQNWYMFNTTEKEYSTGTINNNSGIFPLLPISFVVIRDLKITANWSVDDKKNIGQAVSFGPFDIRKAVFSQNNLLEVKGLMIFAWLSKVTPPLPPTQSSS